jgi:hypothetical protein
MQILAADLIVSADNAALQDGPKAFNRIGMDRTDNMLANGMVNGLVREAMLQSDIAGISIGAEKANAVRYGFPHESLKRVPIRPLDDAGNDVTLALDCADDWRLAGIATPALAAFLVPMPVLVAAANVGFVNLDNAAKFLDVLDHRGSDLVAHKPSGLVRAETHVTEDLEGAHALLADQHQVRDSVPIFQRLIRVLKDCTGQVREAIAVYCADFALPMMAGCERIDLGVTATGAGNALRPSADNQICNAVILSLKQRVELCCGQLVDGFGVAHDDIPLSLKGI